MPASTRAQADDEGITDSDRVSLDDPPVASSAQEEVRQIEPAAFDESATYFPLFCLCNDVPEEVCHSLLSCLQQTLLTDVVLHPPPNVHRLAQSLARNHHMRSLFRIHPRPVKSRCRRSIPLATLACSFPSLETPRTLRIP